MKEERNHIVNRENNTKSLVYLKVCGMKSPENMMEISDLGPKYMGFIFYEKSSRFFKGNLPELSSDLKKVGVFVNSDIDDIKNKVLNYQLNAIQLHGTESAEFCLKLAKSLPDTIQLIKVFSIKNSFDFSILEDFEAVCDYFLFDTKGELPGGNGETFDWTVLNNYPSKKPFFLSGGIGLESIEKLKKFLASPVAKYCHAIDVNSKFEIKPGLKNKEDIRTFNETIQHINTCVL